MEGGGGCCNGLECDDIWEKENKERKGKEERDVQKTSAAFHQHAMQCIFSRRWDYTLHTFFCWAFSFAACTSPKPIIISLAFSAPLHIVTPQ